MKRRAILSILGLSCASALIGCGPPWRVMMQANPDPFLGQSTFAVLPIDFTGLVVGSKPEQVYLAEKDADQQRSFLADKAAINEEFAKALMATAHDEGLTVVPATGPQSAPFMIRPYVSYVEGGFYVGVAAAPSEVRMTLRITTPDGRVLDEIAVNHKTGAGITRPSSGQRLRDDGEGLGEIVAKYLKTRVAPGS